MRKKITISGVSFFFVTEKILENVMEHVNMRIFLPEMQSFILQIYLVRKAQVNSVRSANNTIVISTRRLRP